MNSIQLLLALVLGVSVTALDAVPAAAGEAGLQRNALIKSGVAQNAVDKHQSANRLTPSPTVIVDVQFVGHEKLAAIKAMDGVQWSLEFGSEVLLGVDANALMQIAKLPGARLGPGPAMPDELLAVGHACTDISEAPNWATVGGYDLQRMPASSARLKVMLDHRLSAMPNHGVFASSRANLLEQPAASKSILATSVAQIVSRVSADRWFTTMSQLAAFNRNSYSAGLFTARDWIRNRFVEQGLAPSDFQFALANITSCTPTPAPINLPNVIGQKTGAILPNEWIVVGAHYDSRNPSRCDGVNNPQPGANDNASGCAGVMELAQVFADVTTERSILFMCFSGEEQGLVGSRQYVNSLTTTGDLAKVKLMINMDMIGFDPNGTNTARIESNATHQALINELSAAAALHSPELAIITSTNANGGSDHFPFLQAGVPTAVTWENGASVYPHYHQTTDIPQNMTGARSLAGGILKMDAAVIAARAGLLSLGLFADSFED